eukprot:scaffold14015_cov112-Isochrysis_galbana.AAC.9
MLHIRTGPYLPSLGGEPRLRLHHQTVGSPPNRHSQPEQRLRSLLDVAAAGLGWHAARGAPLARVEQLTRGDHCVCPRRVGGGCVGGRLEDARQRLRGEPVAVQGANLHAAKRALATGQ